MKNYLLKKSKFAVLLMSVLGLFLFTNCETDHVEPEKAEGFFITNEGSFGNSNSSLSHINYSDGKVKNDLFYETNNRMLGDVFQSMSIINGEAYLVVNNSSTIEVVDSETIESIATIDGLISPRFILQVDENTAYVSNLSFGVSGQISIINTSDYSVGVDAIEFPGWSEAMEKIDNKVFVTAPNANMVYVIDPATHSITDSVAVFPQPNSMSVDNGGNLWVLSGGEWEGAPGGIKVINPSSLEIKAEFPFAQDSGSFSKLTSNEAGDKMYYLGGGVWKISTNASKLPENTLIVDDDINMYGLGICPATGDIYLADAADFSQSGRVFKYNDIGEQLEISTVGIAPNGFYFY